MGVCAGIANALILLKHAHHLPFGFLTQHVRVEYGYLLSRIISDSCLARKKSSLKSHCSFGKVHCRVTKYLVPGPSQIHDRNPYLELIQRVDRGARHHIIPWPNDKRGREDFQYSWSNTRTECHIYVLYNSFVQKRRWVQLNDIGSNDHHFKRPPFLNDWMNSYTDSSPSLSRAPEEGIASRLISPSEIPVTPLTSVYGWTPLSLRDIARALWLTIAIGAEWKHLEEVKMFVPSRLISSLVLTRSTLELMSSPTSDDESLDSNSP